MTAPPAQTLRAWGLLLGIALASATCLAKLPAPSDEAKAKAAEAAAKAAHTGKVDGYKLCMAMNRVATGYQEAARKAGKPASAPVDTPACADPGAFAYTPAGAASAPAAPVALAASAPAAALAKK